MSKMKLLSTWFTVHLIGINGACNGNSSCFSVAYLVFCLSLSSAVVSTSTENRHHLCAIRIWQKRKKKPLIQKRFWSAEIRGFCFLFSLAYFQAASYCLADRDMHFLNCNSSRFGKFCVGTNQLNICSTFSLFNRLEILAENKVGTKFG
jgi:hypothetical protein